MTKPTNDVRQLAVDWVSHHALSTPDKLAQIDLASGRTFTYAEMNERIGRVAAFLAQEQVKPGDRVGFLALNSTDIFEMSLGTWRLGAISLALNFRLTAPELAFIIDDAAPDIVFFDVAFADLVAELRGLTKVKQWIASDGVGGESAYEQVLAEVTPQLTKTYEQPLTDQCLLMYSSGTTGLPKGVIITHEMMFFCATNLMPIVEITRRSVNLASMPLFHIGGFNVFAAPVFCAGGTVIVQRTFDPGETLRVIGDPEYGVTHFLGVPAMYNAMKVHPENANTDFSRLQYAVAGAEAVPDPLVNWWYAERGLAIQEGYGMTESAASNCLLAKEDVPHMVGSAGKAALTTQMKIVREDGSEAETGELGELWMRGPAITPGYWNRPEANEKSFVDGWFRSGDIARVDEQGYYYIEDRLKDMYISGGENVYPAEVENVPYGMDQIAEVAVIGVPDTQWGEVGCAVVGLKDGASLGMADIAGFVEGKLARFKQPVHMAIVDTLPRTATGKVLKFELRKTIPEKLDLR